MPENPVKIAYLFTTFPKLSETFLQREVKLMLGFGTDLKLYTLWGGQRSWENRDVYRLMHYEQIKLLWRIPLWVFLRPDAFHEALLRIYERDHVCWINLCETLRGFAFALLKAHHFNKMKPDLIHCTWATMPASAGWLISKLTGIPFTMGAHAYDVFRNGGDRMLKVKCRDALVIHTTTESCRQRLIEIGTHPGKVHLIRRGMDEFPEMKAMRRERSPLRILSVGRLVQKKGYPDFLNILHQLVRCGFRFEARIVGGGEEENHLRELLSALDLGHCVTMTGSLPFQQVTENYLWADVFCFTGTVAPDGDRDGLPNVIPEAMAWGLPVVTTDVAGTTEAVCQGKTGFVCEAQTPGQWLRAFSQLSEDDGLFEAIRRNGRKWVETHYNNRTNAKKLTDILQKAVEVHQSASL